MTVISSRLYEAYYGSLGPESGKIARDLVKWIIKHTKGNNVLISGCSQGILCILLAREGKSVIGRDGEKSAIDFAINAVSKESINIKDLIELEVSESSLIIKEDDNPDTLIWFPNTEQTLDWSLFNKIIPENSGRGINLIAISSLDELENRLNINLNYVHIGLMSAGLIADNFEIIAEKFLCVSYGVTEKNTHVDNKTNLKLAKSIQNSIILSLGKYEELLKEKDIILSEKDNQCTVINEKLVESQRQYETMMTRLGGDISARHEKEITWLSSLEQRISDIQNSNESQLRLLEAHKIALESTIGMKQILDGLLENMSSLRNENEKLVSTNERFSEVLFNWEGTEPSLKGTSSYSKLKESVEIFKVELAKEQTERKHLETRLQEVTVRSDEYKLRNSENEKKLGILREKLERELKEEERILKAFEKLQKQYKSISKKNKAILDHPLGKLIVYSWNIYNKIRYNKIEKKEVK